MNKLENILQAINLADLDELKEVTVNIEDLKLLRDEVKFRDAMIDGLKKRNAIVVSQFNLCQIDKPIKLDVYT